MSVTLEEHTEPERLRMLKLVVTPSGALPSLPLSESITEDYINCKGSVGLSFHILEAGYDTQKPLMILLHGFPELAYSWRKIMPTLASADYYVVAVDQRGYGRTTGWSAQSLDGSTLENFAITQYVADVIALSYALGYKSVGCIVGHDFGANVAAMCALMRPDFFKSCVLISNPFKGFPHVPMDISDNAAGISPLDRRVSFTPKIPSEAKTDGRPGPDIHFQLASLEPPRRHFRWYNAFPAAASDWRYPPQGLDNLLRGYFHIKSAQNYQNKPFPIAGWTAEELARLPEHSVLPLHATMSDVVANFMQSQDYDETKTWLTDEDLAVYVDEWSRTGFQGALNSFRNAIDIDIQKRLTLLAGSQIAVPTVYIAGNMDWGSFEEPGVLQNLPQVCKDFRGIKIIRDAGHCPQQEQPGQLAAEILRFLWQIHHPKRSSPSSSTPSKDPSHNVLARTESPPKVRNISPPLHPSPPTADRSIGTVLRQSNERGGKQTNDGHENGPRPVLRSQGSSEAYDGIDRGRKTDTSTEMAPLPLVAERRSLSKSAKSVYRKDTPIPGRDTSPDDFRRTLEAMQIQPVGTERKNSSPPKPVNDESALDASSRNAEIYKQVSERARQRLEAAEKSFRRMGKTVKTNGRSGSVPADDAEITKSSSHMRRERSSSRTDEQREHQEEFFSRERHRPSTAFDMQVEPPTPGIRL